jgi:hypothetical protein
LTGPAAAGHRNVYRGADGTDRYAAALKFADRRVDVRRPGIDVTISAPKSVSVLFGLGDPQVASAVRDAHQAAVAEALGYLESVAGHGLRGHQGDGQRADHIGTEPATRSTDRCRLAPSPTSRRSCTGHFGTPSAGTQSSATPPMRPIRPGRRASPR